MTDPTQPPEPAQPPQPPQTPQPPSGSPATPPPAAPVPLVQPPPPRLDRAPAVDGLVTVENVSKWFGDLVAVSDVTFGIGPGVTALLGPNGAGKSTMLRMICGLAAASSGEVRVLGRDPRTDPEVARTIGLAPQQEAVFDRLTALEFVTMSAQLQGLDDPEGRARRVLNIVELDPDDRRQLPTYSKGMRQRTKLAQAIVHSPQVILLDEPLSGLDPRQRLHMVELFHRLGDEGRAVIVSSHVLDEVERFGSRVLVIAKGRLAAQGDFREIRALMDDRPRRLRVRTDRPHALAATLVNHQLVSGVQLHEEGIELSTEDVRDFSVAIADLARTADARLLEVRPLDDDLESVFRYLVGRR